MDDKTRYGNLAEIKTATNLVEAGCDVFLPFGGKIDCDLIYCKNGIIKRVQVKSSKRKAKSGNWLVELRSIRSNKTQNKIYKFDASHCDELVIYLIEEDRLVFLEANQYHGKGIVTIKSR